MLTPQIRQTIHTLSKAKKSNRKIARLLNLSRNTVSMVLSHGIDIPVKARKGLNPDIDPILKETFTRCLGNVVRIKEVLMEEYEVEIAYSTLTRHVQNAELRKPRSRVGEYIFAPGEEMQHDTSPHRILIGGERVTAQCASLVLGFSRKIFVQYYPRFTRFEAKSFLKAAIEFMTGCCRRCVIDNTSVILCGGTGADAVIAPEMATFCRMYGFVFMAHRLLDPDRKGKCERPFYYVETNFLAGRTFKSYEDLNTCVKAWCLKVNGKEKRALGMTPDAAFIQEKPCLVPLPEVEPPIYEHCQRLVDCQAYVNLETHRYSMPEKFIGKTVDVYKYMETVKLFCKHQEIAVHPRLSGKRQKSVLQGHHTRCHKTLVNLAASQTEAVLRGQQDELLDQYIDALKRKVRGSGYRPLNRLLNLKRTYPAEAFLCALQKAQKYGLYDLNRLEEMIIKAAAGNFFNLEENVL